MAGVVEIEAQRVQGDHGELGAEGVEFGFAPAAIQAHRSGDVFRESLAVVAFADENVADEASGVNVVDAAAGLAAGGRQAQKYFADFAKLRAVVPRLGRVDFRMMAFNTGGRGLQI